MADEPDYEPSLSDSIGARAARLDRSADELALDVDARRRRARPAVPAVPQLRRRVARRLPRNAHPSRTPCPASATAALTSARSATAASRPRCSPYWGRDRDHDRIPLPFLVQRHCRDTARTVGLYDRGVIAPGYRADLNVVDFDRLRLHKPTIVHDLPAGGRRLLQRATGWQHTIVAGQETYHDGVATDALPGRLIRGAQTNPSGALA